MKYEIKVSIIAGVISAILGIALSSFTFLFMSIIKSFVMGFLITLAALYLGGKR